MKRALVTLIGFALIAVLAGPAEPDLSFERQSCQKAVRILADTLMGVLSDTLEEEGPEAAVYVCSEIAPEAAQRISKETGYEVGRTALKVRNPENAPDAWEKKVLEEFGSKAAKGQKPETLEYIEVVREGEHRVLRYMKAIPTGGPCVTCHGSDVETGLLETIQAQYPQDQATGFKEGDLRGAFTIRRILPEPEEEPEAGPSEEAKPAPAEAEKAPAPAAKETPEAEPAPVKEESSEVGK